MNQDQLWKSIVVYDFHCTLHVVEWKKEQQSFGSQFGNKISLKAKKSKGSSAHRCATQPIFNNKSSLANAFGVIKITLILWKMIAENGNELWTRA